MSGDALVVQVPAIAPAPPVPRVDPPAGEPLRPDVNGLAAHTASLTPLPYAKQLELAQNIARQSDGSPEVAAQLLKVEHIRQALDAAARGRPAAPIVGEVFPAGGRFGFEGWSATSPSGSDQLTLTGSGGRVAVIDRDDWTVISYTHSGPPGEDVVAVEAPEAITLQPSEDPRVLVVREMKKIAVPALGMLTLLLLFFPIIRAWARTIGGKQQAPTRDPDLDARLARIEQAVEAIAIEVERVGEAQRFQTKVLAERPGAPVPLPAREVQHAE